MINIFDEIKERVSMREVLELYGIHPKRGNNIYLCFAHNDRNPSANLTRDGRHFKCFACGFWGDIFTVVQHFENCDCKTAMRIIDTKFGLGLYRQLSHKEKLELARQQKERERRKAEELEWKRFEEQTLREIIYWHRFCEQVLDRTEIKRGQYREKWDGDLYFYTLRKSTWLDWLYSALCEIPHQECEFDHIYGTDKKTILEKIKKGELDLW